MKVKNKLSLFGLSVLSLVGLVLADGGDGVSGGCFGPGMMGGTWGYGGMLFGWLFSALTLVALVLLIVWLIKQIENSGKKKKK
jgi:uncharacterized membrane protein